MRESLVSAGLRGLRWLAVVVVATFPLWFLSLVTPTQILGYRVAGQFPLALPMPDGLVAEYSFAAMALVFFYAHTFLGERFPRGTASTRRLMFYVVWTLIIVTFVLLLAQYVSFFVQFSLMDAEVPDAVLSRAKTTISASLTAIMALTLLSELIIAFRQRS